MSEEAKQGQVVTGVTNNLEIEMKVTKQEVVDMIVQEQEDALDEAITKVSKDIAKVKASGQKLVEAFKLAYVKIGLTKGTDIVAALKTIYPDYATRPVTELVFRENTRYNEETEQQEVVTLISDEEKAAMTTYHSLVDRYNRYENHFFDVKIHVSLYGEGAKPGKNTPIAALPVLGDFRSELTALPELKALATFGNELATLNEKYSDLQSEKNKLSSLGKRAKGKIIRQMLESSDNGKAILAGTRKIGKLALAAPKTEVTE